MGLKDNSCISTWTNRKMLTA